MTLDKNHIIFTLFTVFLMNFSLHAYSQGEKKFIRQGNREYDKSNFSDSEVAYRRAIDKNNNLPEAVFNAGDALYRQDKYEDAGREFLETSRMTDENKKKASSLYNLGNSLLKSDNIKESIDAYKGSLRLDPDNLEAKYNLAYAQDLLNQQQQQQNQQQNQDQNNDQKQNDEQSSEQQQQDQQSQQQENQQQEQQQKISEEDAERILNALANDEKDIQEKVKLAKAKSERTRTLKNW